MGIQQHFQDAYNDNIYVPFIIQNIGCYFYEQCADNYGLDLLSSKTSYHQISCLDANREM